MLISKNIIIYGCFIFVDFMSLFSTTGQLENFIYHAQFSIASFQFNSMFTSNPNERYNYIKKIIIIKISHCTFHALISLKLSIIKHILNFYLHTFPTSCANLVTIGTTHIINYTYYSKNAPSLYKQS